MPGQRAGSCLPRVTVIGSGPPGHELPGTSAAPVAEGSLQRAHTEGKMLEGQLVLGNGKEVPGDLLHSVTVFWVERKSAPAQP